MIGLPKKKVKNVSTRPTAFVLKLEWEKTRGKVMIAACFDDLIAIYYPYSYAQTIC